MLPVVNGNLLPTVSRFFDDDWNNLFDWTNPRMIQSKSSLPSVNIMEEADQFVVEMAVPGMKKEDFNVSLHNNVLTIKAENRLEDEMKNKKFARREFNYHSFQRTFNLDGNVVNDAKIAATYKDGILKLILPKKDEAKEKPAREIKIS